MGIHADWRGVGLGSFLVRLALSTAFASGIIKIVWLDVYVNNLAAIQLYKKSGFKVSGVIPRFFNHDGILVDKIQMYIEQSEWNK